MERNINPFLTTGYHSHSYFCNREDELNILRKNVKNGIHTTLISARRLGKTALIYRLFEDLEQENYACIYSDIYACTCLKELTESLALAIFKKFPQKHGIGRYFLNFLKKLRPVITYDALNGQPEIRFDFAQSNEYEHTLRSLLEFIDNQQIQVVLAMDEFSKKILYFVAEYSLYHLIK